MNPSTEILKQDRRGRVVTPAHRREELLAAFAQSGLSGVAFARMVGVKYSTFATWRCNHRHATAQQAQLPVGLVPEWLEVERVDEVPLVSTSNLCVMLPGGAQMMVNNVKQASLAAALLNALQPSAPSLV